MPWLILQKIENGSTKFFLFALIPGWFKKKSKEQLRNLNKKCWWYKVHCIHCYIKCQSVGHLGKNYILSLSKIKLPVFAGQIATNWYTKR